MYLFDLNPDPQTPKPSQLGLGAEERGVRGCEARAPTLDSFLQRTPNLSNLNPDPPTPKPSQLGSGETERGIRTTAHRPQILKRLHEK